MCSFRSAGIVFLSGGLSEDQASSYLSEMQHVGDVWNLSFSFGRALQHSCLKAWGGTDEKAGQKALLERAKANSMASYGIYEISDLENHFLYRTTNTN